MDADFLRLRRDGDFSVPGDRQLSAKNSAYFRVAASKSPACEGRETGKDGG